MTTNLSTKHAHATACPSCGTKLDFSSPPDGGVTPPKVGDATLCLYCAALLIYADESLTLRRPTLDEAEAAEALPDYALSLELVRTTIRRRALLARVFEALA